MKMKKLITLNRIIAFVFIAFFLIATADISHSIGKFNGLEDFKETTSHHDWAVIGEERGFVTQMIREELYLDEKTGKTQEVSICDYRNAHETLKFKDFEQMTLQKSIYKHEVDNYTRDLMIYEKLIKVIKERHGDDEPCIIAHDYMMIADEVNRTVLNHEQKTLEEN